MYTRFEWSIRSAVAAPGRVARIILCRTLGIAKRFGLCDAVASHYSFAESNRRFIIDRSAKR